MAPAPRLKTPFPYLNTANLLARGAAGHIFAISEDVVFKCPTMFHNPVPQQILDMEENIAKVQNEMTVQKILMNHRHPNIVHTILCIPEGFFMQREIMTLEDRIQQHPASVTEEDQLTWIMQLASAMAWLEKLEYAHGDLRPSNLFLDSEKNLKLGDFDATVKIGSQLVAASEPFCRVDSNFNPPIASAASEQFAVGGCIYAIRYLKHPLHDIEAPIRVKMLRLSQFPDTSDDALFDTIIQNCWHGRYRSVLDLEQAIQVRVQEYYADITVDTPDRQFLIRSSSNLNELRSQALLDDCMTFLELAKGKTNAA